jgi:hypothetical protein
MFLGNPPVPMPCSPTPAGPEPPGLTVVGRGPPTYQTEGYPRVRQSRGSIARLEHSLSTLRPRRYRRGRKTRFRLPARLYRVGLVTHRVPTKGFRDALVTSLPPFPSFHGAKYVCQLATQHRRAGNRGQSTTVGRHGESAFFASAWLAHLTISMLGPHFPSRTPSDGSPRHDGRPDVATHAFATDATRRTG